MIINFENNIELIWNNPLLSNLKKIIFKRWKEAGVQMIKSIKRHFRSCHFPKPPMASIICSFKSSFCTSFSTASEHKPFSSKLFPCLSILEKLVQKFTNWLPLKFTLLIFIGCKLWWRNYPLMECRESYRRRWQI